MPNFFDVFISYGRADSKGFATKLNQRLIAQGLDVWFDQDEIPPAVDFQEQINNGIEKAHNFIFIIAPHSVNSAYCLKEINLALKYNKRIIPILHVEEISQETWLSRKPNRTQDDWQEHQSQGRHSIEPNMHPTISQINWINCREHIDDFATSFEDIINALSKHQKYVENHTKFLVQALDWLRNQKQTNYLLIGEEKQAAEKWLKHRFVEEQSPCVPTDLQCEFICESIKNANNLMTQVFLSASDKDNGIKEKIGKTLIREGFTIWTNQTDIKTGTDFEKEIKKGIEGADNFVYFISPDTLESQYCQQEFAYAAANNKRIIPLRTQEIDDKLIPSQIQKLQFIEIIDSEDEENYCFGIDELLKELKSYPYYYQKHKLLLVKALKWHRNNRNPSLLLRGYNLQHFEDWLKVAKKHQDYPPLPLQEEFVTESLQQPKASSLEVFISYSRADSDFARRLNDALLDVGKLTWFDQESIASGADFEQEIDRGIENCDNFLFIISPKSVNSPFCAKEVEYAESLNKRIVTVVCQPVSTEQLHPVLAKIQWIDFNQHGGDFSVNFPQLVRTIDTDREHVHSHTKWSQRAREWSQRDKTIDLLLRGSEFQLAQNWLMETEREHKQPSATNLQKEFIVASHKAMQAKEQAEQRRQTQILQLRFQKFYSGVVTIGLIFISALGLTALFESRKSKISEIKAMSLSSEALFASEKKLNALIEAIKAKRQLKKLVLITDKNSQNKADKALQQALFTIKEHNRLSGHYGAVLGVAFSPDGQLIASGSTDNRIILWKQDGELRKILRGHEGSVNAVAFSPDSKFLVSVSADNTIKLWKSDGTLVRTFDGQEDSSRVVFSADGSTLAIASKNQTVQLWNWDGEQATLRATLKGDNPNGGSFNSVALSPDNQLIAAGSDDNTIKIWQRDGTLVNTLQGHIGSVKDVAFSSDSQLIASASEDSTIKIWQRDGTLVNTLQGHIGSVKDVAFSPDGQRIASAGQDKTIKLWQRDGTLILTLRGHRDKVTAVDFSPDGTFIISGSGDNSVRLWKPDNSFLKTMFGHRNLVRAVDFSPDGQLIASGSEDRTVKLWHQDGTLLRTLQGHSDRVYGVAFSPNSQLIASASADQTVKLWQVDDRQKDAKLLKTFKGHRDQVYGVAFSPDGQLIVSGSADQTIKIWQRDGTLLRTLEGHREEVNTVLFSLDGQLVISGSGDNTIKIWQRDGILLRTLEGHKSTVFDLDISPDGQLIISGSADNTIKMWNIEGKLLTTLAGHTDSVLGVKFQPNFKRIASASVDKTIKLWQLDGNKATLETTLMGHDAAVESIDYSPDSKTLASGSDDRTVILWTQHSILNLQALIVHGCNWVRNYLKYNRAVEDSDRTLCDGINE